jgi:crotonobetainyl-CoA:carnitine CoA-transferase CaiB-like acyl-CoA transferase
VLQNIKVLDFSKLLPGPYATMMLADLGAEILRVEAPGLPDLIRDLEPLDGESSAAHQHLNRSKKSITLDLKKREAVDIVKQLIQEYDVVLEQFRPGVMERLGLDYETLKQVNSNIIYCSLSGYGQTGPYRDRAGHDNNYLSIAGINGYSGRKQGRPVPMGIQIADLAGGSLHSVIAILTAIIHRQETGEGQYIDLSMTDATFALNAMLGPGYITKDVQPEPEGTLLNGAAHYDYYETKDRRYFSVGSLEAPFRISLCDALNLEHMKRAALSDRSEDMAAFKAALKEVFLTKTYDEWMAVFLEADACVEPVLSFSEAVNHSQIQARNMITEVPREDGTAQQQISSPFKFSAYQQEYKHVGTERGEHTMEILKSLGLSEEKINLLIDQNVFGEIERK